MEALKDIFVPYENAVQLKEIGFDSECIGYYNNNKEIIIYDFEANERDYFFIAPTYEQVKKWFREKNYQSNIVFNFGSFYGFIEDTSKIEAFATDEDYTSYEEAREQLILKLIEIYKNDKK